MSGISEVNEHSLDESSNKGCGTSFYQRLDYIPGISSISGAARIVIGQLGMFFGVFLFPFDLYRYSCSGNHREFMLINGIGNLIRGNIATHPIVGNIVLFLYDRFRGC